MPHYIAGLALFAAPLVFVLSTFTSIIVAGRKSKEIVGRRKNALPPGPTHARLG